MRKVVLSFAFLALGIPSAAMAQQGQSGFQQYSPQQFGAQQYSPQAQPFFRQQAPQWLGQQSQAQGGVTLHISPQDVQRIKYALSQMGFDPGQPDGYWRDQVAQAIAAFQQSHGLQPTGTLDLETVSTLAAVIGAARGGGLAGVQGGRAIAGRGLAFEFGGVGGLRGGGARGGQVGAMGPQQSPLAGRIAGIQSPNQ